MLSQSEECQAIKCLRKTIRKFTKSAKMTNILEQKTPSKLHIDVKTRWNSIISMIQSYLPIQKEVKAALIESNVDVTLTLKHDGTLLKVKELLEPVEKAINLLSAKDVNLITADLILCDMMNEMSSEKNQSSQLGVNLKRCLMENVMSRRTIISDLLWFFFKSKFGSYQENMFYNQPEVSEIKQILTAFIRTDIEVPSIQSSFYK